jgi:hypothetical protein
MCFWGELSSAFLRWIGLWIELKKINNEPKADHKYRSGISIIGMSIQISINLLTMFWLWNRKTNFHMLDFACATKSNWVHYVSKFWMMNWIWSKNFNMKIKRVLVQFICKSYSTVQLRQLVAMQYRKGKRGQFMLIPKNHVFSVENKGNVCIQL